MPFFSLRPDSATAELTTPLAVVMPVYNEEEALAGVLHEWISALQLLGVDWRLLAINDGSRDRTLEILKEFAKTRPELVVVDKTNTGHGRTCRLGYEAAVASHHVEWVLQIDSDGQCDPSALPRFWEARIGADCVFGKRQDREDGWCRTMASKLCRWGTSLVGGTHAPDPNVPFRLIKKEVLARALTQIPPAFNLHNIALAVVLRWTESNRCIDIPINFRKRAGGTSSTQLIDVAHTGMDMLLELRKLRRTHGRQKTL